jgi:hypothetical protein
MIGLAETHAGLDVRKAARTHDCYSTAPAAGFPCRFLRTTRLPPTGIAVLTMSVATASRGVNTGTISVSAFTSVDQAADKSLLLESDLIMVYSCDYRVRCLSAADLTSDAVL